MMTAIGSRDADAGFLRLLTHGVFKALLFLGAGAVIHAVHSNEMKDMGGLFKRMPQVGIVFIIGTARPINLGALGFPVDLFVLLAGVTYLFAIASNSGTVERIIEAASRLVRDRRALIPLIVYGSVSVGERILHGHFVTLSRAELGAPSALALLKRFGAAWVVGGAVVGLTAGIVIGTAVAFAAASFQRRSKDGSTPSQSTA